MEREPEPAMSEDQLLARAEGRDGRYALVEGRVTIQAGAIRDTSGWPDAPTLVEGPAAEILFPVIEARLRLADIDRPIPG